MQSEDQGTFEVTMDTATTNQRNKYVDETYSSVDHTIIALCLKNAHFITGAMDTTL